MTRREERAWAAGLFEGEGCFSASTGPSSSGGKYHNRTAKLSMTDELPVRRFHHFVGVGTVRLDDSRPAPQKVQWLWQVSSLEGVQHVAALLWDELGERRRGQARAALA